MSVQWQTAEVVMTVALAGASAAVLVAIRGLRRTVQEIRALGRAQGERKSAAVGPMSQNNTTAAPPPAAAPPSQPANPEDAGDELPEEILLAIAAAVAAYVGTRVHVRRARLLATGVSAWAQQGRVSIQASHNLGRA